jgi:predicted small integral membrane protein
MDWMAWTLPTAIFFIVIAVMLAGMTVWEVVSPTVPRRGFLPMTTTRGDRLFIGLLGSAYINLAGIYFTEWSSWTAVAATLVVAVVYLIAVMRWG